jgi:pantoate--beta-alanine ligase
MREAMRIIHAIPEMREAVKQAKQSGVKVGSHPKLSRTDASETSCRDATVTIGLIPTMGALHCGHLSLIARAVAENNLTVVSVFVNPIQFEDKRDFDRYAHNLESDAGLAASSGADILFAPRANEMYPEGFASFIDMRGISETLCGASREAHFRGVCTVVGKLFHIIEPNRAYFGKKDAQQLAVIRRMTTDLNFTVDIIGCPTVRDADGLALSSRNARLSPAERSAALCLRRALRKCADLFDAGETDSAVLILAMHGVVNAELAARIDYAEIVNPLTFQSEQIVRNGFLAALAAYIGETRLIDNVTLGNPRELP